MAKIEKCYDECPVCTGKLMYGVLKITEDTGVIGLTCTSCDLKFREMREIEETQVGDENPLAKYYEFCPHCYCDNLNVRTSYFTSDDKLKRQLSCANCSTTLSEKWKFKYTEFDCSHKELVTKIL